MTAYIMLFIVFLVSFFGASSWAFLMLTGGFIFSPVVCGLLMIVCLMGSLAVLGQLIRLKNLNH